jgi:hypothetical protein
MNTKFSYIKFIVILTLIAGCLSSCERDPLNHCQKDYDFYTDNYLYFRILDKRTAINVLEIGVNRYTSDTVQVYDKNLNPLGTGTRPQNNGYIVLGFLESTRDLDEPLNTPLEHTFYLHFEKKDYDTIRVSYQIGTNKCEDRILTEVSASYNDSVYFNRAYNPYRFSQSVDFIKKVF